ncbi:MAG: glycolate oxidase subunit GlcE [Gammaproteobacteria bacterium]|nr:glycolate oxidase subunit GlcE [Gammaproteobacteria bacterium]
MTDIDFSRALTDQVAEGIAQRTPMAICGLRSKRFIADATTAPTTLDISRHCGVIDYRPTELVVTARAGTPLAALAAVLAGERQSLACDPPRFGGAGTLGGAVASGFSGPARPWLGSVRDAVLGVEMVNGRGERLKFGGTVMKNVAGFDLARLNAGAWGTFGVLLAISIRVHPLPESTATQCLELNAQDAQKLLNAVQRKALPITATVWHGGELRVRLQGSSAGVRHAQTLIGGAPATDADSWSGVRDHNTLFFTQPTAANLWCLSVPPASSLANDAEMLIEWGGARRWLWSDAAPADIHAIVARHGGHARCVRGPAAHPFTPLPASQVEYQQRLRAAFDPDSLFNPHLQLITANAH